jgi:serine/threonine protein kinase
MSQDRWQPLKDAIGTDTKLFVNKSKGLVKKVYSKSKADKFVHELEVYTILKDAGVRHLMEFIETSSGDEINKCNYVIMKEYQMNLETFILKKGKNLTQENKSNIVSQLVEFMTDCHSAGVSHLDFKAKNIMVDTNNSIWVTDFDLSGYHNDLNIYDDYKKFMIMLVQIQRGICYKRALDIWKNEM